MKTPLKTGPDGLGWSRPRSALSLIEVLIVITVIAVLVAILVPAMSQSRQVARQTACLSGLRQVGVAVSAYAMDHDGSIPYGPKAPPPSATNFYPLTGNVTSLLSLESGAPVGLGLLLHRYLAETKQVLFCPGADQEPDTRKALEVIGRSQVQGSYYYRHASVASLSGPLPPPRVKLDQLGENRNGAPIRCLAMDSQFLAPPALAAFNIRSRTHHQQRVVNTLFADGHAGTFPNADRRYVTDVSISVYNTLDRILEIFELFDPQ